MSCLLKEDVDEKRVEEFVGGSFGYMLNAQGKKGSEKRAFLIFGFFFSRLVLKNARLIKNYKTTCLDDAHFIISALRGFFLTII